MAYSVGKFVFDQTTKIATLDIAHSTITIQEIVDTFRDFEDLPEITAFEATIAASGKDALPDGSRTVITATLLNGWKIAFAARPGPTLEQGTITGGNLLAVTGGLGSSAQFPISPTANISISLAQATTGALLGSLAPEFGGFVYVDAVSGSPGTAFPIGTSSNPVDNMVDAITIAQTYGIRQFAILSTITITNSIDGYVLEGVGGEHVVTLSGATTDGTVFENLELAGTATGDFRAYRCEIIDGFIIEDADMYECGLDGTIVVSGRLDAYDCFSHIPGLGTAAVDLSNSATATAQLRRYAGGLTIQNAVSGAVVSLDLMPASLTLAASVTGGTFKVRGIGEAIVNNGTPDSLDADGFFAASDVTSIRKRVEADEILTEAATGNYQIIDADDGVTVLATYTVLDKSGLPITIPDGSPARRSKD